MNSNNSILLVDPEFDPNTAGDCNLLLKMTMDSFSYAIIDKNNNQVKALYDEQECEDLLSTLAAKIKNDSYLALPFKEIKASVYTENTLNIPNELFDTDDLNVYAQYFTSAQSDNLYTQPFPNFGFTAIFTLDQFIEEILRDSLNHYKLYDQAAPVLALAEKKETSTLLLDFTVGSFNATYTENGKLIFQNYYQTDHSEEFNYYLLFIISQLNMNTSATEVCLSGIIHTDDAYYQCIAKYFQSIAFSNTTANDTDSTILDDMPAHYYSSLLALDLCV